MRVSKKIVLEYLESVYPDWKSFEQICNEIPIMFNFDVFELQSRIDGLFKKGKIEKDFFDEEFIGKLKIKRYRIIKK